MINLNEIQTQNIIISGSELEEFNNPGIAGGLEPPQQNLSNNLGGGFDFPRNNNNMLNILPPPPVRRPPPPMKKAKFATMPTEKPLQTSHSCDLPPPPFLPPPPLSKPPAPKKAAARRNSFNSEFQDTEEPPKVTRYVSVQSPEVEDDVNTIQDFLDKTKEDSPTGTGMKLKINVERVYMPKVIKRNNTLPLSAARPKIEEIESATPAVEENSIESKEEEEDTTQRIPLNKASKKYSVSKIVLLDLNQEEKQTFGDRLKKILNEHFDSKDPTLSDVDSQWRRLPETQTPRALKNSIEDLRSKIGILVKQNKILMNIKADAICKLQEKRFEISEALMEEN